MTSRWVVTSFLLAELGCSGTTTARDDGTPDLGPARDASTGTASTRFSPLATEVCDGLDDDCNGI